MNKIFVFMLIIFCFDFVFSSNIENSSTIGSSIPNSKDYYLFFDIENKSYALDYALDDSSTTNNTYKKSSFFTWLYDFSANSPTDECIINWDTTNKVLTANFFIGDGYTFPDDNKALTNNNILSYLNNTKEITDSNGVNHSTKEILKNNLWMRVEVEYRYENGDKHYKIFYVDDDGIDYDELKQGSVSLQNVTLSATIVETKCPSPKNAKKAHPVHGINPSTNSASQNSATSSYSLENFTTIEGETIVDTNVIGAFEFEDSSVENPYDVVAIHINGSNVITMAGEPDQVIDEINRNIEYTINGEVLSLKQEARDIALISHNFKTFETSSDAKTFIDEVSQNMNDIYLKKEINNGVNKTNVTLNFDTSKINENTTLWAYFPKDTNLSLYDFGDDENLIIKDLDPIVGWKNPDVVFYSIEGESVDPAIYFFYENAITYNSKNLIFNYRVSKCFDKEIYLFTTQKETSYQLTDDHSEHLEQGDDLYNLCVSHFENYTFDKNFNIDNNLIGNLGQDNFELFKNYGNLNYYYFLNELQPGEDFSCMGSTDLSGFGDCDFNEQNRIWVYLGEKNFSKKPKIDIVDFKLNSYTNFSFKVKVENTQVFDMNLSIGTNTYQLTQYNFTNNISDKTFSYDCSACLTNTTINLYAKDTDLLNQFREVSFFKEFKLPRESLRCNSDCTNNMDGRIYFACSLKNPSYCSNVPQECNGKLKGTWAEDGNYEVKCELPFNEKRVKRFTKEKAEINFEGEKCENIVKDSIPVKFEGQFIRMVFLMCAD